MPLIDAVGDTGKFVGAILGEPDRYEGKVWIFGALVALFLLFFEPRDMSWEPFTLRTCSTA